MSLNKASRRFGMLFSLLAIAITTFLVSDANAQTQYCECHDAVSTVAVRTVPVRRTTARKYRKVKRTTVARRAKVVRPAYQAVYVPVREVEYAPQYVEHVDDDCDDVEYSTVRRVVVTERAYPTAQNVYYTNGIKRNGYYANGYTGNRVHTTNGYAKARVYVDGSYSNLDVDADYFSTTRIAADYGYRDGYDDGHEVGLEREMYNPHKEGDFRNGTDGYEGDFGSKDLYKQAYRDAYLKGYDAGFRTVAQRSTYRAVKW